MSIPTAQGARVINIEIKTFLFSNCKEVQGSRKKPVINPIIPGIATTPIIVVAVVITIETFISPRINKALIRLTRLD